MKRSLLVAAGIAAIFSVARIGFTQTTDTIPGNLKYSYAVKFVCGFSSEEFQEGVVRGVHATAINIHNPHLQVKVAFAKKIARALPYQTPGRTTAFEHGEIGPNQAIEVECNEIRKRLPAPMTRQFRTGFVVIVAAKPLDVTAVYSARPSDGEVSTIDIEIIEPRKLARRTPPGRPDLTVRDIDLASLNVDCPAAQGSCVTSVDVQIANIGAGDAGAFNTRSVFDPRQSVVVDQPFPNGLTAGAEKTFNVTTPPGGNCFDSDCTVCVTVDDKAEVDEVDETNNQLCKTKGG